MEQDLKRFFGQVNGLFATPEQLLLRLQPVVLKNIPFMKLTYHFPRSSEGFPIYFLFFSRLRPELWSSFPALEKTTLGGRWRILPSHPSDHNKEKKSGDHFFRGGARCPPADHTLSRVPT